MRALAFTRRPAPGTLPEVVQMMEIPAPKPRRREAMIRVLASTINIDDIHVAEGTFYGGIPLGARPRRNRPVTPGSDVAGVVVGVGPDVRSLHVGDAVFGVQVPFRPGGSWAEMTAVDERWLTPKPENLSFGTAAACGVSGLVAASAIQALRLRPGLRLVVVGASGGIGGVAVQLAARNGAEVIGVCSSAHAETAARLGCSLVLDYHGDSWAQKLRAAGRAPVNRVLDTVGGRDVETAARHVLRPDGIFVTVVGPERFIGDRPLSWAGILTALGRIAGRIALSRLRGPRYILTGPSTGGGGALPAVAEAAAAGILPPIDSTVPFELDAMRQALRRAASHRNHGRIVIQMEPTT
jgi:NADPH:quinone reductase-like Zn-dependent oxidoreductase